jgi:hypothetical protein
VSNSLTCTVCSNYYSCRDCEGKSSAVHKSDHWMRAYPYRKARQDIIISEGKDRKGLSGRKMVPFRFDWENQPWEDSYALLCKHATMYRTPHHVNQAFVASLAGVTPVFATSFQSAPVSKSAAAHIITSAAAAKNTPAKTDTKVPSKTETKDKKGAEEQKTAEPKTPLSPATSPSSTSTISSFSLDSESEPIFAGMLQKKAGGTRRFAVERWQERWFILYADCIDYYPSESAVC